MQANKMLDEQRYAAFVERLVVNKSQGLDGLMHAAVGVAGEAGEILDAVKKVWVYNKPLDRENLVEELGDIEFYLQQLRNLLGVTREETIHANVAKLNKRYPNGYTDFHAAARLDKAAT
jgi:NTP pyrophosphatase (non-canonical NTP hydrolase)